MTLQVLEDHDQCQCCDSVYKVGYDQRIWLPVRFYDITQAEKLVRRINIARVKASTIQNHLVDW